MSVITISHQLGSGGGAIAQTVAECLGYECVAGEVLAKAAHTHGLTERRLIQLGEAKPRILERLDGEAQTYVAVMQNAILEAALGDHVVLVGRGGQWLLRGISHVLRIRIVAPFDERVRRLEDWLAARAGGEAHTRATREGVEKLLHRDDAGKLGRMRYLYDRELDDQLLYDVFINNAGRDGRAAVQTIVQLAQRAELSPTAASVQTLVDRSVASRVRVALLQDDRTRGFTHHDVTATSGVVRVTTNAPRSAVERIAGVIDGVRSVQVAEVPTVPAITFEF